MNKLYCSQSSNQPPTQQHAIRIPDKIESIETLKNFFSQNPQFKCKQTDVVLRCSYSSNTGFVAYVNEKRLGQFEVDIRRDEPKRALIGLPWLNGWGPAPMVLTLRGNNTTLELIPIQGEENLSYNSSGYLQYGRTGNTTWMQLSLSEDGVTFTPVSYKPNPEIFYLENYSESASHPTIGRSARSPQVDVSKCQKYVVSTSNERPSRIASRMHISVDSIKKYNPQYAWERGHDWRFKQGDVVYLPQQNAPSAVSVDVAALSKVKSIKTYDAKRNSPYILRGELLYEYDANLFPIKMTHKSYDKGVMYDQYSIAYDGKTFNTSAWNFQGDSLTNEISLISDGKGHIGVIKEIEKQNIADKAVSRFFVYVFLFDDDGIAYKCIRFGTAPYGIEDSKVVDEYWAINSYDKWLEEVDKYTNKSSSNDIEIAYIEFNSNGDYYINDFSPFSHSPLRFNSNGALYIYANSDIVKDNYRGLIKRYQNRTYQYPYMPFEYEIPIEWSGCISNHESSYETPQDNDDVYTFKKILDSKGRLISFETLKLGKPYRKIIYEYVK